MQPSCASPALSPPAESDDDVLFVCARAPPAAPADSPDDVAVVDASPPAPSANTKRCRLARPEPQPSPKRRRLAEAHRQLLIDAILAEHARAEAHEDARENAFSLEINSPATAPGNPTRHP